MFVSTFLAVPLMPGCVLGECAAWVPVPVPEKICFSSQSFWVFFVCAWAASVLHLRLCTCLPLTSMSFITRRNWNDSSAKSANAWCNFKKMLSGSKGQTWKKELRSCLVHSWHELAAFPCTVSRGRSNSERSEETFWRDAHNATLKQVAGCIVGSGITCLGLDVTQNPLVCAGTLFVGSTLW